ncbi:hypothetical protein SMTE5_32570 [Serratia marcescens]|jgi:hypothetical protein|uniref:Flavin-dependent dehydrogenase n=3 Tax=Serratia TaxID=613 RepID=A0AA46K1E3_SERMA|nr:hypothetical protein [Serratia marcescens]MBI6125088.1 hypothetical protein [Serratia marcescens]TQI82786.1 flavin-dependent dehydrogenase [Serratia marcescens]BEM44793.1 hypothetical protein SME13J_34120 [Serratia marcescens]BEO82226.1 hypothetical protein SMTE5_32570 [Serratia marcescens]HAY0633212.1 hypothetical protein [Serratia marcescens]
MRQRIAIVGGGVTAGMAARLLAPLGETTLIQPGTPHASGMPEIVPRRPFFSALGERGEDEWVAAMAPSLTEVSWRKGARVRTVRLASTEDFLVYDKTRLARLLLDGASVARRITGEVGEIAELQGFDRVFDCRGARAVKNDPAYQHQVVHSARTACRYLVVSVSPKGHDGVMRFWAETAPGGNRRTFFRVPVGRGRVSLGCSCFPDDLLSDDELHAALEQQEGARVSPEAVLFSGAAVPQPLAMHCRIPHVTPLGDAGATPCPLTEYGVLKALSQIMALAGGESLPEAALRRTPNEEVDPHLPQELFS